MIKRFQIDNFLFFCIKLFTVPEDNNTNERFAKIVEDSKRLFWKYGFKSLSMDDIARELGVSKKTLYQFVTNKTDLIKKTFECEEHMMQTWIAEVSASGLNAIDELLAISQRLNRDLDKFKPEITYSLQKYYPDLYNQLLEKKKKMVYNNIMGNIEKGIEQGLYRDNLDVELVAALYVQKMTSLHSEDLNYIENLTFDKIFEVMFENHIRGIANPDGIVYFESQKEKIKNGNR